VLITTYEALNICLSDLKAIKFHVLIFDEAHKLKNADSVVSKNSRLLSSKMRLLLTGTPLQNNMKELWSLLNFLMPELFSSADDFEEWFDLQGNKEQDSNNSGGQMESIRKLHKILRPFLLRRTKKDIDLKLPPKVELNIQIGLTEKQTQIYTQLIKEGGILQPGQLKPKQFHNLLMQLRKACNHPYLFQEMEEKGEEEYGYHIVKHSGKMLFLDKLLMKVKGD